MRILLDTNIVLDLLLEREPFCNEAKIIFEMIEANKVNAFLCATTITTIYYLTSKSTDKLKTDAEYFNIDVIITRDKIGFKNSNIKVLKPSSFLENYKF